MRSFVSHLVAACLALHTLLGCCVHHAHAEHAHLGTLCQRCDDMADEHSNCDHHAPGDEHLDADHARHKEAASGESIVATDRHADHTAPCSGSCGEKCQFVATGRVQLENPVTMPDLVHAASAVVDLAAELPWVRAESWLTAPPALPLRLHLWNGLLQI